MPDLTADLVALTHEQEQIRRTAGSYEGMTNEPGLVTSLSLSGATDNDIQAVAGFARGLQVSQRVALARQSGIQLTLNDEERGLLTAMGTHYDDVDLTGFGKQWSGGRGLLGNISHVVNETTQLPVLRNVFAGLDRAYDIGNTLYRQAGPIIGPVRGGEAVAADQVEAAATMRQQGYQADPLGTMAFYSRGKLQFHSLDELRTEYSPEMVDDAKRYVIDPQGWMADRNDVATLTHREQLNNDPRFQQLVKEVDGRHLSPGRDVASGLGLDPGTKPFTVVSGSTDALWSFFADPTLVAGKANAAVKTFRYGVGQLSDAGRVESLMRGNRRVRRGWSAMLDDARIMRSGSKEDAAAAYARVANRTPDLLPVLDEINGGGLRNGKVIEDYEDLIGHVTGTTALVRMRNGIAAREAPLMPGALSAVGFRQVRGALAAATTRRGVRTIDLRDTPGRIPATAVDGVNATGDVTGLDRVTGNAVDVGVAAAEYRRTMRGRLSTTVKRMSTLLPEHQAIDLTSAAGAEDVRRFAALYMPKSHANALAARYAVASVAERRAIAESTYVQTMHAAGIPSTTSGKAWLEQERLRRKILDNATYDASGEGRDRIVGTDGEPDRAAALYVGQTSQRFYLPDFAEMRRLAAKVSIYDYVMRSGMESSRMDGAMSFVRTLWLVNPAGAERNILETVLNAQARGVPTTDLLRARGSLTAAQRRMNRAAKGLTDTVAREVDEDLVPGTGTVGGVVRGRTISGMRRLAQLLPGGDIPADEMAKRADEIIQMRMAGELHELEALAGLSTRGAHQSVDDAVAIMDAGFKAQKIGFGGGTRQRVKVDSWKLSAADGLGGARAWANELGRRFAGPDGAYVLRAAVDGTEHAIPVKPSLAAQRAWAAANGHTVPKAGLGKKAREAYAKAHPPRAARDDLVDYLLSPDYAEARASLERFAVLRDGTKIPDGDSALLRRAAEELADDQVADMRALITGRNGEITGKVVEHLVQRATEHGVKLSSAGVPQAKVLHTLPEEARPAQVIQPQFIPDLSEGNLRSNIAQGLMDSAYRHVVAAPFQHLAGLPLFHVNYARAYRRVEKDMEAAHPEWAAEDMQAHIQVAAYQHAMDFTVQMMDNPRVRSQMSLITRNVFNFWRAQEDFARRWSKTLVENPAQLRKAQLVVEGGTHVGLVHENEQGELVFTYPGSGYGLQAVGRALGVLGLSEYQGLGVQPNLTTKMQFLNSGLNRPFVPSTSPVASLPLRILKHFTGDQVGMIEAVQIAEGDIGSARSWWAQYLPSPVYRVMASQSKDEREGQYASAARNTFLNLYAADKVPQSTVDSETGETVPPSPDQQEAFRQRVKIGVRNQLASRALLSMILPGAPGNPTEETEASKPGDLAKGSFNSVSLQGEFRAMVSKYGYPKAMAVWTASHPDDLVYTVSATEGAGGSGGYLPPTSEVLSWVKDNDKLARGYPSLAAYFAPDGPGDFSTDAWRVELELGLRQHKDLDTFYRDIVVKNAETTYYKSRDAKDLAVQAAEAAGNDDYAKRIKTAFTAWSDELKKANPMLLDKWQQSALNKNRAAQLVTNVGRLAESGLASKFDPNGDLSLLHDAYRRKQQWDETHKGRTDDDIAQRAIVDEAYRSYVGNLLGRSPYLIPLYRGVFDRVD